MNDKSLHFDSMQISKEWFEIGASKDGVEPFDVAFRFIAFWIAFNGHYAKVSSGSEHEQIEIFMKENSEKFSNLFDFDNDLKLAIFRTGPVFRGTASPNYQTDYLHNDLSLFRSNQRDYIQRYRDFMDTSASYEDRLTALIFTIYDVRCNMFHGGKTPSPDRNYELVDASQWVLEKMLIELRKKN